MSPEQRAADARFQGLLEAAPDAIVIVDAAGTIVIANTQAERLFGYQRSDMVGQSVEILLPKQLRALHERHRDAYYHKPSTRPMGSGLDLVACRKDGSEFPVEISLSPFETPDGMLVISVIRDVTDRKRAADELEAEVLRRTAHLNVLLQFSQQLLLARSLDAVLQKAINYAMGLVAEAQHGAVYLFDDVNNRLVLRASVGFKGVPQISVPTDFALVGRAFTTRQFQGVESRHEYDAWLGGVGPEERKRILEAFGTTELPTGVLAFPLIAHDIVLGVLRLVRESGEGPFAREARGTLEGLSNLAAAAILEERSRREAASLSTEVERLEEQHRMMAERLDHAEAGMLQAARLAAVGQLSASIAHEINNPLYAARNCLYLLEEDLPPDQQSSPYLAMARDQLTRIAGIIERMRDFYRPTRGDMAPCDLNQILEETLALAGLNMRHGAIKMIFAPARDLPRVLGSDDQLRQVFLNLVLNAIDAMPNGGTLTVRTEAGPSVAIVEIQDTGVGIPDAIRARIFEPFFTNKPTGTGLGLAICGHIVTQHSGQIEVESREGEGTTFRVALPYRPRL
ncbi:MAG: ATP-binding protein [Anaerolineae bacterium]